MPTANYDQEKHWHPVADAFSLGTGSSRRDLRRLLSTTSAKCVVYEGIEPVLIKAVMRTLVIGFVIVAGPQEVIWAYVKPRNRNNGLLVALLDSAGIDTTRPIHMLTRTPASDQIVHHLINRGWQITLENNQENPNETR